MAREDTDRWFEVDDATACRKACQTLRENKTPRDQKFKRKMLWRKWVDLEQQQQPEHEQHQDSSEDSETDNIHRIKIGENINGSASFVLKGIAVPKVSTSDKDPEASAAHPLSSQEQKAGKTLLELTAATDHTIADV